MSRLKIYFFVTAMTMARLCFAQSYQSTGSDILPTIANGQMSTGAHYDPTGEETSDVHVYGYSFQNNPDDPYFDQDPGINAPANSGLGIGTTVSFNILSSLTYWNGTGPVIQTAPPDNEQVQYNFAIYNVYVTGTSGSQPGFNIAAVASNQSFHRHLNAFLLASDGNADASDGVVATPGIYMLTFQIVDQGVATSQPLYIVYDNGLDSSVLDQARTYLRNAYAPLTNLPGLSNYPNDPGNFPSSWNTDANENWSSAASWNLSVPSNAFDSAMFGQSITIPRTITIDSPQTVGHLGFDNINSYTLAGTTLTLGDGSLPADVVVNSGSHTIAARIYLSSPTTFTVQPAKSTLTISSPITSALSSALAKEGAGTLLATQINSAGIDVVQGTLRLVPGGGVSIVGALSIQSGATLDLTNNAMIVNYSHVSPISSISASVAAAADDGKWDLPGITSSTAAAQGGTAVGVADNAILQLRTFDGVSVGNSAVLLRYTWLGDANLDGVVNGDDLNLLLTGQANQSTGWQNGDFNYDGIVNGDDFALFMLGAADEGNPARQIPEPICLTICLFPLLHRHRLGMFPKLGT